MLASLITSNVEEQLNNWTWTLPILQFWAKIYIIFSISLSDDLTSFMVAAWEQAVSTINKYYVNYADKHCVDYQQIWCQLTAKIVSTINKRLCTGNYSLVCKPHSATWPLQISRCYKSKLPLICCINFLPPLFPHSSLILQATSTRVATYPVWWS